MKYNLRQTALKLIFDAGEEGISHNRLYTDSGVVKSKQKQLSKALSELSNERLIYNSAGKYRIRNADDIFLAAVGRVVKKNAFAVKPDTGEEYFVLGAQFVGAVPGDIVLLRFISGADDEEDKRATAEALLVYAENKSVMTGTTVEAGGHLRLIPDEFGGYPLTIVKWNNHTIKDGDKVSFIFHSRADRYEDMTVDITGVYGSADKARNCVSAYLDSKGIPTAFSEEAAEQAKRIEAAGITEADMKGREDLRSLPIFTIDGADTKDIDDAVSIERTQKGYRLGVHIADVSHYVKENTPLAKEAFKRGTSVYIADLVVPMLPKELSNGICSLNPGEDRLAFSCFSEIDRSGNINDFRFSKTVIRSRVKGVYSEVNALLGGEAGEDIKEKYGEVLESLPVMKELAELLIAGREGRGAPDIDSVESKIICDERGVCTGIKKRERGFSERIIEEFMLCANRCAAKLAMDKGFPFVYRIHEKPAPEKLLHLAETLVNLGADPKGINERSTAADLAEVLRRTHDDPKAPVFCNLVLRTMMKAKYSDEPVGHYGLVLKEYSHFTSPIRRYADLSIHTILSAFLTGGINEKTRPRFEKGAHDRAQRASVTELIAVEAERECDKFYMAEYMREFIGEEFDGYISGVTAAGFFVELENTVAGRVDTVSLPIGEYEVQNDISLVNTLSGRVYTIGDAVRVKCAACDIAAGVVDFVLVDRPSPKSDADA